MITDVFTIEGVGLALDPNMIGANIKTPRVRALMLAYSTVTDLAKFRG